MALADSPTKQCGEDGCSRPLRARGLCSTHYNQQHQPDRHRKVTVACGWCGKPCQKDAGRERRYGGLYCSLECRDTARMATEAGRQQVAAARLQAQLAWTAPRAAALRKARRASRGSHGHGVFVGGHCHHCGAGFVALCTLAINLPRWCSDACRKRAKRARYRARVRGCSTVPYSRRAVCVRDGWRCHLCHQPVDSRFAFPHPGSATMDHLVPVSAGGADALDNVRLAHMICNARRRDVGDVQLLLFG